MATLLVRDLPILSVLLLVCVPVSESWMHGGMGPEKRAKHFRDTGIGRGAAPRLEVACRFCGDRCAAYLQHGQPRAAKSTIYRFCGCVLRLASVLYLPFGSACGLGCVKEGRTVQCS